MKYNATLNDWFKTIHESLAANTFVKLALTKPTDTADTLKSVDIRPIMVKRELKLSFTFHHKTNDIVKNYSPFESEAVLAKLLAKSFLAGRIFTLKSDILLAKRGTDYELTRHGATTTAAPELSHDKPKQRLIESSGKSYLHALGITDAQGNVLKNAQDKFRQINKYVEILDGLIKQLPDDQNLTIADMGSGKGYLTFALYDHLINTLHLKATVKGIEFRPELVKLCNDIAKSSGFSGLTFIQGSIADYDCTGTDVVIALHACDTATDDALNKAIRAGSQLIVVAPCCHKQIRREMGTKTTAQPLEFMLKFGTYTERMAEMVTDALRAQYLELSGYTTNLFEFISDAHTPKNVMIVATRQAALTPAEHGKLLASIVATKAYFGIKTHQLERLLGL